MKDKKYICDTCYLIEESKTRIVERPETYEVKGEPITVLARVRVCGACNQEVSDETLDDATLQAAYDVYRRKHKIIFPSEIRAMRDLYGLSQRGLGAVLDWGPITIHRYETGSLPDESHNQVLRFVQDPYNMAKIIRDNPGAFDRETYRKIINRLFAILSDNAPKKVAEVLGQSCQRKASVFTGFLDFQPETLMEMMVFFAHKAGGVLKTKLNKLLWYADFVHYKHNTLSISGAAYCHFQYGPVPENYESFLNALCANDALVIDEMDLGKTKDGEVMVGQWLIATREPQLIDLSLSASKVLDEVHNYFAPMGSKKISNLSHKEEGYLETKYKQLISYEYADRLKVDPIAKPRKSPRGKTTSTAKTEATLAMIEAYFKSQLNKKTR